MARRRRSANPPRPKPEIDESHESPHEERLQKVLAAAGVASRRECEELILAGRVEVDRHTVTELGTKVDPLRQDIRVDGVTLPRPKRVYYALNKPPGVVCTNFDPSGRTRVVDMIPTEQRIFPVGRLDRTSEGLILVTNDGSLANRLTHPRYGVCKTYQVLVAGHPSNEDLDLLRKGVRLAEGWARAESVKVHRRSGKASELLIVLREGRNREIRRMLARIEHKVLRLRRVAIGPIRLGNMPLGAHRKLTLQEVEILEEGVREARRALRKAKRERLAARGAAGETESTESVENAGERATSLPSRPFAPSGRIVGEEGPPRKDKRRQPNRPPAAKQFHPAELAIGDDDEDGDGDFGDDELTFSGDFGGESFDTEDFGEAELGFAGGGDDDDAGEPRRKSRRVARPRPPGGPPRGRRPRGGHAQGGRTGGGRAGGERPSGDRPSGERPGGDRSTGERPRGKPGFKQGSKQGAKQGSRRPEGGEGEGRGPRKFRQGGGGKARGGGGGAMGGRGKGRRPRGGRS